MTSHKSKLMPMQMIGVPEKIAEDRYKIAVYKKDMETGTKTFSHYMEVKGETEFDHPTTLKIASEKVS